MDQPAAPRQEAQHHTLRGGAIGLIGLITLGAVMMSPALGIYGNWGPMAGLVGKPTPLVFIGALVISMPTAISYAVVSRAMPSAGSAFTWVWRALAPGVGRWVGMIMAAYYLLAMLIQPIFFGLFFNDLLRFIGIHGVGIGTVCLGVGIVTAIAMALTYRGIELSTKAAVTFILVEMLTVVALAVTIIVTKAGDGGLSLAPFDPGQIHGGLGIFWQAMILGIFSFTGFDVISTVAEEAQAPKRLLPKATVLATVLVGLFWIFNSWAFSISVPVGEVDKLNAAGLTAATPIAQIYWGWGRIFVIATALSAVTAVYIATNVGASRALFALAREGVLPASLAKLNPRYKLPWRAMSWTYGITIAVVTTLLLTLRSGLDAFVWGANALVLFALVTYIATNLANFLYFWRRERSEFNWLLNGAVPFAGIALDAYLIYKSFFHQLWGAGFRLGQSIVIAGVGFAALAVIYVLVYRRPSTTLAAGEAAQPLAEEVPGG